MPIFFRCKKVYDGVTHAAKLYPNAYVIMILIGTLKGKLLFVIEILLEIYNHKNKTCFSLTFWKSFIGNFGF